MATKQLNIGLDRVTIYPDNTINISYEDSYFPDIEHVVTSIKGNAEVNYRTGKVNLTPANLGISATSTSVTVGNTTFNKYTHPTTSGNKHIPSGGSSGQFLGWDSDGTAKWVNNPNTNTDTLVTQTATTTDANYEILFSATADNTTRTETARKNTNLKFNPSSGKLSATQYEINAAALISYNSTTGCVEITT